MEQERATLKVSGVRAWLWGCEGVAVCSIMGEPCRGPSGIGMPMRKPLKPLATVSHWAVFAEHVLVYGDQVVTGDVRLRPDPCASPKHIKSMQEHRP